MKIRLIANREEAGALKEAGYPQHVRFGVSWLWNDKREVCEMVKGSWPHPPRPSDETVVTPRLDELLAFLHGRDGIRLSFQTSIGPGAADVGVDIEHSYSGLPIASGRAHGEECADVFIRTVVDAVIQILTAERVVPTAMLASTQCCPAAEKDVLYCDSCGEASAWQDKDECPKCGARGCSVMAENHCVYHPDALRIYP